jgi:hypothetical protein
MEMTSILMTTAGGIRRTREELRELTTPAGTASWRPVPHFDLVASMAEGLEAAGIQIIGEAYTTSGRGDAKLFGIMDLVVPDVNEPDYRMAVGLRGSNDKSMAISAVAGARVLVCSNMLFSGDSGTVVLKRKHSSRLDLSRVVPPAIDAFLDRAGKLRLDIQRLKETTLSDTQVKSIVFDAFARRPILPGCLFRHVSRLYFDDAEQRDRFPDASLWSLNQAFTESAKLLRPEPQARGLLAIGRYFGRLLHRDQGWRLA